MDRKELNRWITDLDEVCSRMEWTINALNAIHAAMTQSDAGAETFLLGLFGTWMQLDEQRQQLRALLDAAYSAKWEAGA